MHVEMGGRFVGCGERRGGSEGGRGARRGHFGEVVHVRRGGGPVAVVVGRRGGGRLRWRFERDACGGADRESSGTPRFSLRAVLFREVGSDLLSKPETAQAKRYFSTPRVDLVSSPRVGRVVGLAGGCRKLSLFDGRGLQTRRLSVVTSVRLYKI